MSHILDDKSEHCVPFVLKHYEQHRKRHGSDNPSPMFVGLQGVQGAGKTTLVDALYTALSSPPHNISTLVFSIDDLYLSRQNQKVLAEAHPNNALVQHRGVPGTHDMKLGDELFQALEQRRANIALPSYDKSAHNGAGDRRPRERWRTLNPDGRHSIDLVIFEGWCVGFEALTQQALQEAWQSARDLYGRTGSAYRGELAKHELSSLAFMNSALKDYDAMTKRFTCFVQIDAEDLQYVYDWRLEQEAALRRQTGSGMNDDQVIEFVNGYYPAYELYTNALRQGIFSEPGRQLRLIVDKNRRVKEVAHL